jgi:hypothetical protein
MRKAQAIPALLVAVLHAVIGNAAAIAIAQYSADPFAAIEYLSPLSTVSAAIAGISFAATIIYLSRRVRPMLGVFVGVLCGLLCGAVMGLTMTNVDFEPIPYLTILAPTLLSVLLASLLERPRSGWQT